MTPSPMASLSPLPLPRAEVGLCTACPSESTTEATGAIAVTLCFCEPGWVGEIETGASVCTACEIGAYKEEVGPGECIPCTENADTALPGSADITACRCMPAYGRDGPIVEPDDTCDECVANTFKETPGNTGAGQGHPPAPRARRKRAVQTGPAVHLASLAVLLA